MQLDLSARRRRYRWWLVPLAAVLLWAGLPRLAALWPAASAALSRAVGAHYTAQLDALQKENFTLHQRLAQSADALAENASLRQLAGCRRTVSAVTPARVIATGGIAKFVIPLFRREILYDRCLMLKGLRLLYKRNTEHKKPASKGSSD